LAADPSVQWGVLGNGVRYAVRYNAEPTGRVSRRLLVAAGSLNERENERGIAHFIEHMAYRGTREHPDGGMTAELQRLGIGFGPDTAAFTFWDHTIYQLDLPDAGESTLREGLGVFREYAQDITFDPRLIDRERDVIQNERDTRDTPNQRVSLANLGLLWPDSLQLNRSPIGLVPQIRQFRREQFLDFYDAWYRPERMAVIVVGDIDPATATLLVEKAMGGVRARGPARADAVPMSPPDSGSATIRVFEDPGIQGAECLQEHPFPEAVAPDTHERRVEALRRSLAFAMLQHRAARLSTDTNGRFVVPVANVSTPVPGWAVALFGASGTIDNWKEFMGAIEQEHRRAYMFGFTGAELEVARRAFKSSYENAVNTSATWPSDWIAGQIANSVVQGSVFSTPAAIQRDMAHDLDAVTTADCLAAYRRAWTAKSPHVFVATNTSFRVTPSEIADALNESRETQVKPPVEAKAVDFAYSDPGPPGTIVRASEARDLGVKQAEFANGVRLNFKQTSFDADSVTVAVRVGTGRLSQPESKPGLDILANELMTHGGLGKHSLEDLQDILASHAIVLSFAVDNDALAFSCRCAPKDLALGLKVIAAYLTDAAYRAEAMPEVRASIGAMYASMASSPSGPITAQATRILSGDDRRFGTATPAELNVLTFEDVRDWIDFQLRSGPVELSVVGDIPWEEASAQVAASLGALPKRVDRSALPGPRPLGAPQGPSKPVYLLTLSPSLHQVAVAWFCPVGDLSGVHMERRCRFLASMLAERLRVRLREELGAAYGFDADFVQYDGFPDLSFFAAYTAVAPEHARRTREIIQSEILSLQHGRFSDDEFERVRQPFLRSRDKDVRDNSYWAYTVLKDAQQRPERLTAARDRQADCESISRSDVEAIARKYFAVARWFQFVAYPDGSAAVKPFESPPITRPH
jgi:zinc protease